ncbi:DNA polymerase I [Blochmannia endosymbiont of Camponotus (Colobopsis) obliquus]|uniref:DNA polymerase I n=1 Tax=Blochmannia endosymbiont of Camponotus (Colobopsis) obliquus TaxID=1505597 RepID=UPI00061A69C3|nr:DNA polymerase I [Blochmannia endosymbiont of Camponotus (Colobopsis) obliquus]AKC60759.1 DNA polymerase I [Blochmannia endosymbiont of Camponotus (Colobopsis) obliquus]
MFNNEKLLIIIDGSSYLYRAYHAYPALTNTNREPTWVIYGVLNMLKKVLVSYKPNYMVVVFDSYGQTFRKLLFEKYKIHRPSMPIDLCLQVQPLCKLITAMGIPLISIPNVEGDDIIGTLALFFANLGRDVVISSNDKDMAQLVSTRINLVNFSSNILLNSEAVRLKFGVYPKFIVDYLSLVGDLSDNIPGVPTIGKKTACTLLHIFGSLEMIYRRLNMISSLSLRGAKSIAINLKNHQEMAFLSYKLASIKTDISVGINHYRQLSLFKPNIEILISLFQRYEFNRWLKDIQNNKWLVGCKNAITSPLFVPNIAVISSLNKDQQLLSKNKCQIIYNMRLFNQLIIDIRSTKFFSFDIKIDNADILTANLVGMCLSVNLGEVAYLPILDNYTNINNNVYELDRIQIFKSLQSIFEDPSISKIGQDLKIDCSILKRYNINLYVKIFDIIVEMYLLYNFSSINGLVNVVDQNLIKDILYFKKNFKEKKYSKILLSSVLSEEEYLALAQRADVILQIHCKLWPKIAQELSLKKIFKEIEMPLIPVLSRMECTGVLIDKDILDIYSLELMTRISKLELTAHSLVNESFNLSSTKQLQKILYDKQKIPVLRKTPKGHPSTNEEVLSELSSRYPISKIVLEYRNLVKLRSTYTKKLPLMIHQQSKRIHTSYNQTMTVTGRLASSNPNLQNIPVRSDDGRRIRQSFIAPTNFLIVSIDYSQIELRIMAHLSKDKVLTDIFLSDQDVHCITASEIFATPLEKVTVKQRRYAKTINFGLLYGMTAFGLAKQLSVTCVQAQYYIDLYFKRYSGVKEYMQYICTQANLNGYVTTIEGRKLYISNIYSGNDKYKKNAGRKAINAPMQGTAADIIKRAMIAVDSWVQKELLPIRMIMQIHDELVFEIRCDVMEHAVIYIKNLMETCFLLSVPLRVKVSIGKNWGQLH